LDVHLRPDGTWDCDHADFSGKVVAASRLSIEQTSDLITSPVQTGSRRWVRCPYGTTYWRVWPRERIARPSIEWNVEADSGKARCYHVPLLDIGRVIQLIVKSLPSIIVRQHLQAHVADDEGLW